MSLWLQLGQVSFFYIRPSSSSPKPPRCMAASHIVAQPFSCAAIQQPSYSTAQQQPQSPGCPAWFSHIVAQLSNRTAAQPFSRRSFHSLSHIAAQPFSQPSFLVAPDPPTAELSNQPFFQPPGLPAAQPFSCSAIQLPSLPAARPSIHPATHYPASQPSSRPAIQPHSHPVAHLPTRSAI
jgi:hypothetical protein